MTKSATDAPDATERAPTDRPARTDAPKLEIVGRKNDAAPAQAAEAKPAAAQPKKKGGLKKLIFGALLLGAIGGGAWYGHQWWMNGRFMVTTDDAYVGADMAILSPKVTGYIQSVPVTENQSVKAGDPIIVIDGGDYALALRSTEAKIAAQNATITRIKAQQAAAVQQVAEAEANREAAVAAVNQSDLDLRRASDLVRSGTSAQAPLDQARSAKAQADAKLAGADASLSAAKANVAVFDAQITEAEAALPSLEVAHDQAERDLSFTTIRAPYDGVVGNLSAQPGDLVSPGRRLAAIVPLDQVYVDANFKETQLHQIALGEKVRIEVDAMPGVEVEGKVVSLSPASGSVFSLLPADNATGNFTKIVQRVPVRIEIDRADEQASLLRPGLSVTVAVDTRTAPGAVKSAEAK
ncbi:HlyD family secretion protein [Aureimonas sp. D3]|uniref:HlyD family secretion protein n=1 Tax=Aureimonas sp. D3 TaxID=1638164 RepID=UPI000782B47B|nr:HlyD family secretion protein [Aureimonas sp. D3]